MSEGVRRLAILLGGLGVVVWLAYAAIETEFFTEIGFSMEIWALIIGMSVVCFFGPFGIVHGVAWVIRGFKQKKT